MSQSAWLKHRHHQDQHIRLVPTKSSAQQSMRIVAGAGVAAILMILALVAAPLLTMVPITANPTPDNVAFWSSVSIVTLVLAILGVFASFTGLIVALFWNNLRPMTLTLEPDAYRFQRGGRADVIPLADLLGIEALPFHVVRFHKVDGTHYDLTTFTLPEGLFEWLDRDIELFQQRNGRSDEVPEELRKLTRARQAQGAKVG